MREIKFRAWDVKRGHYFYPSKLDFENRDDGYDLVHDGSKFIHEVILEQFTGLHDRNGEEIYEGDIIAHRNNNSATAVVMWNKYSISYVAQHITYPKEHETSKGLRVNALWQQLIEYVCNDFLTAKSKVIGNKHENTELLENQ